MNKIFYFIALLSLYVLGQMLIISPIFAEDRERPVAGRYYLSSEGGVSFTIGGGSSEFINRMRSDASLKLAGISITATLSNDSFDFDDVFKTPKVFGLSLGYGVTDSTELFSRIQSTLADAEPFDIAQIKVAGTWDGVAVSAGETLAAEFNDYKEWACTIGARHYIGRDEKFSPFISIEGGVGHVEEIELDILMSAGSIKNISFYSDSWIPKISTGVGISYEINKDASFTVESGVGYQGQLNADDADWAYLYKDINNAGERWSVPLTFGFKIRW
jgi:hypothetical protein